MRALGVLVLLCGAAMAEGACRTPQPYPYPDGFPYVTVHANARNNGWVPGCPMSRGGYAIAWQALDGGRIYQPNTFSPDGTLTYVLVRGGEGRGFYALDTQTGQTRWSVTQEDIPGWPEETPMNPAKKPAYSGSVEVDNEGNLYYNVNQWLVSRTQGGHLRWQLPMDGVSYGLHFTEEGFIALVTEVGTVMLVSRQGEVLDSISIPQAYGFLAGNPSKGFDLFLGGGDAWGTNTIGIGPGSSLYAVGKGPDEATGAVVRLDVRDKKIEPSWVVPIRGSSASSPAISPDGRWLTVADSAGDRGPGGLVFVDISGCAGVLAKNPCSSFSRLQLKKGKLFGPPAFFGNGDVFYWDQWDFPALKGSGDILYALNALGWTHALYRGNASGVAWKQDMPGKRVWSSAVTILENQILGTISEKLMQHKRWRNWAVGLDPDNGEILWQAEIPGTSLASVVPGPDGHSLYIGFAFNEDTRATGGGLIKLVAQ